MCKSGLVIVSLDYGGGHKVSNLTSGQLPQIKGSFRPRGCSLGASFRGIFHGLEKLVWAQSRTGSKRLVQGNIQEGRYPILVQES